MWTRRRWLVLNAGAVAGSFLGGCHKDKPSPRERARKTQSTATARRKGSLQRGKKITDPAAISDELFATPRERIFQRVASLLHNGADREQLWQGLHHGMSTFGGDRHGGLATISMNLTARDLPISEQLLPLMWAADALKHEQASAPRAKPLKPIPKTIEVLDRRALITRLHEAFAASDADNSAACLLELHARDGQTTATEQLYICAARHDHNAGHGTMWAVQGIRVLDARQWQRPERMLDSMMRHLLPPTTGQTPPSRQTLARYGAQRHASAKLTAVNARLKRDDDVARQVLVTARSAPGPTLANDLARRLEDGEPTRSMWDGLLLAAAELALNDTKEGLRGVHALDTLNALHGAAQRAASPKTRVLALLMAADRLSLFRPERSTTPTIAIDALSRPNQRPESVTSVLADNSKLDTLQGRQLAAAKIADFAQRGTDTASLKLQLRRRFISRAAMRWHRVKYPTATLEEAAYAGHLAMPLLLAATVACLPAADDTPWPGLPKAQAAIAALRS